MIFAKPLWLMGICMNLDSMRRGFVGGSSLSLFVIKEFGLEGQAIPTLNYMRGYLAIEEQMLAQIPPLFSFLAQPFNDYHLSSTTFLAIVEILAELQQPASCDIYWEKEE